jgi:hypothetical protein
MELETNFITRFTNFTGVSTGLNLPSAHKTTPGEMGQGSILQWFIGPFRLVWPQPPTKKKIIKSSKWVYFVILDLIWHFQSIWEKSILVTKFGIFEKKVPNFVFINKSSCDECRNSKVVLCLHFIREMYKKIWSRLIIYFRFHKRSKFKKFLVKTIRV